MINSTADMPIPVRLNGSSDFTCSSTGTSAIVADSMTVSPRGEALSPKAPPASTTPMTRARFDYSFGGDRH